VTPSKKIYKVGISLSIMPNRRTINNTSGIEKKLLAKGLLGLLPIPIVSEIALGSLFSDVLKHSSFRAAPRYAIGYSCAVLSHATLGYFGLYGSMFKKIAEFEYTIIEQKPATQ
jgi:hypothetical protein